MSWEHDPEIMARLIEHRVRNGLIRSAVIWTPLFLLTAGGCLFYMTDRVFGLGYGGTWFLVVVLGVLGALFGFQAFQALLDLRTKPREETGTVSRRWSRSDSLVMRSHYIRVGSHILRGDVVLLDGVKEGDEVRVRYFPHSAVLVAVEKAGRTGEDV
ncbi:MAG: DUF3827 domain-containing protein [Dehalococcoidia bacterium]|nr:DUF3827 domain-containing protein [Dehalococcoidia bacterium]